MLLILYIFSVALVDPTTIMTDDACHDRGTEATAR